MAMRALAADIAIGKEMACLLIVKLFGNLLDELAVFIQMLEIIRGELMVDGRGGTAVNIKRNAEILKRFLDKIVVAIHYFLNRDSFLSCADSNGYAVLIRAANKEYRTMLQPQVAHVNISRYIYASEVSDMNGPIGVGECCCNKISFKCHIF